MALKRIAKLKQRITYENISITIKKGNNRKGHSGIKSLKNFTLCVNKPIIKIDKPKLKDKYNVIAMWLVKAIPNGVILIKLHNNIKKKTEKIKGK